ncbi:MAG TPA: hypothetical protein VFI61_04180 [Patescibacteria group bacterium]|nr:hypothetical protein [Patescibacteria group bacterium]
MVELLVAFGISSILIPAIILGFISGTSGKVQQEQRLKATGYIKEAEEATRNARDTDWVNVSTNGTFHPIVSGGIWTLVEGTETIGDFTRKIDIADVSPADLSKKQITVTVSWSNIIPTNMTSTFILTRWKNISSTLVASGTLLNFGSGDWCAPSLSLANLDLPKSGVANAISAIQGQLAAGTGDNAAGVSYANVSITDPASPVTPSAVIAGTYDGFKTNDVFTEQNYAYLATDTNSKEVDIINLNSISGGKYAEAGFFNAPGNGNASSVATSGNIGYMTGGTKLYNFDLTSKSGSRPIIDADGITLPGTAAKMVIYGQRAYITTSSTSNQLVIVDISNSSNLTIVRSVVLDGLGGKSLYINSTGTRAYVATASSASKNEMFIVNIDETTLNWASLTGAQLTKGTYDTNGMDPYGIVLVNLPKVVIVGHSAEEYQVVDVTTETTPSRCGGLDVDTGINGVSTVFTTAQRAYAYIVTGDASTELKIIEGGPGAGGGGGAGGGLTVESPALDAGHSVIFNRIGDITVTPSTGLTATYQIAVSTDCSAYNYTGNYTTAGGQIPLNINPGRCFRYKVTFSGTPGEVSTSVSVNYSP